MSLLYEITLKHPHKHLFSVTLTLNNPNPLGQIFKLPNWIPGSYLIRDFSKNIVSICANSEGQEVPISKIDKNHWITQPCESSVTIVYEVYAFDLSVRSAYFTNERAFFNGTSVFLLPLGFEHDECELVINLPSEGQVLGDWQCATTLKPKTKNSDHEIFTAENYNDLIDHPVEMADFTLFEFEANNTKHKMAITGMHNTDLSRLRTDLISVCEHHMNFFGGEIPFDSYLFLTLVRAKGYGGLEHKKSTSLICSRSDLPFNGMPSITPEYTRFLALCSHEYFHAWWIKTIKPASFHRLDFDHENYTEQLWIFEGFTSYYDELSLLRSKILTPEQYLTLFSQTVTKVQKTKGRLKQSITESSFDAWTKFYQQDENAPNSIVSYYSKGALLAFVLDIEIMMRTKDEISMDDVVRHIWNNYKDDGLDDDSVKRVIEDLTRTDFSNFFDAYVYGVDELPIKESFNYVGVDCRFKHKDTDLSSFGISAKDENGYSSVTHVFDDTSAQLSGIYVGDLVVSVDKVKVGFKDLQSVIGTKTIGDTITLGIIRDEMVYDIRVNFVESDKTYCVLSIEDTQKKKSETLYRQKKWFYR